MLPAAKCRRGEADRRAATSTSRATARGCSSPPIATASSASSPTSTSRPASSTTSATAATGTSSRSRCRRTDARSPSITNEAGVGVLRLYDAATRRALPRPALPIGSVRGSSGTTIRAISPSTVNERAEPGRRRTRSTCATTSVDALDRDAASPDSTRRSSAAPSRSSGRASTAATIGGFIIRPPAKFTGKRPVHRLDPRRARRPGATRLHGPLELLRQRARHRGHRAERARLDRLRQDVRHARQRHEARGLGQGHRRAARLDRARSRTSTPSRVLVEGGSYGGYMVLAVATHFPDRIAGAIDVVGIANFVTFLENTESYRRDLRRVEYGDERDPAMRAFLTRISPVNNADADQGAAVRRARQERSARAVHRGRADRRRRRARTACRCGTCSPTTRATASRGRRTPTSCSTR